MYIQVTSKNRIAKYLGMIETKYFRRKMSQEKPKSRRECNIEIVSIGHEWIGFLRKGHYH